MNREDFPILDTSIIYFDNAATTMKPQSIIDETVKYYTEYTANAHRGDYDNSLIVDKKYEGVRDLVKDFINANRREEIVFTSGATESLNMIIFGFMANYLKKEDEVILTKSEHASNILPWLILEKNIGIKIKYLDLDENYEVTYDTLEKTINSKTKVISLAHITNAIGDIRPIEEIGKLCKTKDVLLVVDATQSIGHLITDVEKCNIDFLTFSAHKMLGPTGTGVLYGRFDLLDKTLPICYGGGMNAYFDSKGEYELKPLPERLEDGTQNIAGVIGLGAAIAYLNKIGLDKIHEHEVKLKKYLLEKLKTVPNIKTYNNNDSTGILIFNVGDYFSQDVAIFLNQYKICVRAGNHCAKILKEALTVTNTCRISLYLYNTKEEIDKLVEALMQQDKLLDTVV